MGVNSIEPALNVVWLIDPKEKDSTVFESSKSAILELSKNTLLRVFPVSLRIADSIEVSVSFEADRFLESKNKELLQLEEILEGFSHPGLQKPNALVDIAPSPHHPYEMLISFSKKVEADILLVSSHARRNITRVLLGSFTEDFLRYAEIPLYVVSPRQHRNEKFEKIKFATDFTELSKQAFVKILNFAKAIGARVDLFTIEDSGENKENQTKRELLADNWIKIAQSHGVHCNYENRIFPTNDLPDSIAKAINGDHTQILAIATHGGAWNPSGEVSVARRMIRISTCPIWVFNPELKIEAT